MSDLRDLLRERARQRKEREKERNSADKNTASVDKNTKSRKKNAEATKEQTKAIKEKIALEKKVVELKEKLKKQTDDEIKLAHRLLVADQNRIDALRLKQREDNKRLNIESQLSLQLERDIELSRKIELQEKERIATQNKLVRERDKNRNKLKLLQERVHSYGLELKKTAGGSELLRKALKGDAIAFQKLSREIEKARKEQGKYDRAGVLTTRGTRNVHGSLSVLRSKLLLASFAFGGATRISRTFTEASKQQESAVARVTNVIKAQGYISGVTTNEVKKLASSLQESTGVTDELTLESSALLLSFQNIGSEIFPTVQKAVLDMTSALNGGRITTETLKTQSIQLAKALDDPIKGLSSLARSGTTFDKKTQNQIKTLVKQNKTLEAQKIILDAVNRQYGDSASLDTYETAQRKLDSAIGDLNERIGEFLTPTLKETNKLLAEFINSISLKDIAETATSIGIVSGSILILNKRMRDLIFTSAILTGGLSALAKVTLGLGAVFGVKKLLDYTDAFSSLDDSTKSATESTNAYRESLGKLTDERLQNLLAFDKQRLANIDSEKKAIEEEVRQLYIKAGFVDENNNLTKEGAIYARNNLKNNETLNRLQERYIVILSNIKDTEFVINARANASDRNRNENLEEVLKKLREQEKILQEKKKVDQELVKIQIQLGLVTVDTSDASIEAIEEQIKANDRLAKSQKRRDEIQKLSFQLVSELATLQHTLTINSLQDINALEEAELNRIKNTSEYKMAVAMGDQKKIESLEKKAKDASYDERIKKFNADQNLAKANILISLAQSVMKAYSDYGFPAGNLIEGLMGAISLAQLSAVNSAPKPEKYQYGGLVGGNLHSGGGTIIEAERGEFVMSRNAVQNFGIANMEAINNGSASPVNITFNNPVMSEDYTEDVIIPQIKRAVQRGADIGVS